MRSKLKILLMLIMMATSLSAKWYFSVVDTLNTGYYYSDIEWGPDSSLHFFLTNNGFTFHYYTDSLEWHCDTFINSFRIGNFVFGKDSSIYAIYKNIYRKITWQDLWEGNISVQETIPNLSNVDYSTICVFDTTPYILFFTYSSLYHDNIIVVHTDTTGQWKYDTLDTGVYAPSNGIIMSNDSQVIAGYNKRGETGTRPIIFLKNCEDSMWIMYDSWSQNPSKNYLLTAGHIDTSGIPYYIINFNSDAYYALYKFYRNEWIFVDSLVNFHLFWFNFKDVFFKKDSVFLFIYNPTGEYYSFVERRYTSKDTCHYLTFLDSTSINITDVRVGTLKDGEPIVVFGNNSLLKSSYYKFYPYPEMIIDKDSLFSYGQLGDTLEVHFRIRNIGDVELDWNITTSDPSVDINEPTGILSSYKDTLIYVKIYTESLHKGLFLSKIFIQSNDPFNSNDTITLSYYIFQHPNLTIIGKDDHIYEKTISINGNSGYYFMRKFITNNTDTFLVRNIIARLAQTAGTDANAIVYVLPDSSGVPMFSRTLFIDTVSVKTIFVIPTMIAYYRVQPNLLMSNDTFWVGITSDNAPRLQIQVDTTSTPQNDCYIFDSTTLSLTPISGNFLLNAFCITETNQYDIKLESYENDGTFEIPDKYIVPSLCQFKPKLRLINNGLNDAFNIPVVLKIHDIEGNEIYSSERNIAYLGSSKDTVITFDYFRPGDSGISYTMIAYSQYNLDEDNSNDTIKVKVTSSKTEWLVYDLGILNQIAVVAGVGGGPSTWRWKRLNLPCTPALISKIGFYGEADSIIFRFYEDKDTFNMHEFEPEDTFYRSTRAYGLGHSNGYRIIDISNDSIIAISPEIYVAAGLWGGNVGYTLDGYSGLDEGYFRAPVEFAYLNREDSNYAGNEFNGRYNSNILRVLVSYIPDTTLYIQESPNSSNSDLFIRVLNEKGNSLLVVQSPQDTILNICIYNILGQKVQTGEVNIKRGNNIIHVGSHLKSGIYFLLIRDRYNKSIGTHKIFKYHFAY